VAAFVTGIAPTQDVDDLEKMLGGMPGLDHSKFVVITKADRTDEHDDSFLNFVHAASQDHMLLNDPGTSVPGINPSAPLNNYLTHPHVIQHVGNLPIPDDEADNYNDAIENGRTVVAYPIDGGSADSTTVVFKAAGLAHVKSF